MNMIIVFMMRKVKRMRFVQLVVGMSQPGNFRSLEDNFNDENEHFNKNPHDFIDNPEDLVNIIYDSQQTGYVHPMVRPILQCMIENYGRIGNLDNHLVPGCDNLRAESFPR